MTEHRGRVLACVRAWRMVLLLLICAGPALAATQVDIFDFPTAEHEARYRALIAELRCPKCLNTNLAGSDAPIAQDLRRTVHRLVTEGQMSDEQIRSWLQERYGDFVLYDPPFRPDTWVLWLGPAVFLLFGVIVLLRLVRQPPAAPLSAVEAERLRTLLGKRLMFWVMAGGLLIGAALFVAFPLLRSDRRRVTASADSTGVANAREPAGAADAVVRALYRDRVAELEAEVTAGRLDPEIRQQVLDELGTSLLDDYREFEAAAGGATAAPAVQGGSRRLGWALALALPLAGLGVYWIIGEPTADAVAGAAAVLRLDPEQDRAAIESWRERLERRVALEAEDAQSWYLLGSVGLQLGDFGPAAEAFARAADITGPDPVVDVYWLQARYLAQGGQLDPRSREIAERILARQPSHPLVLELYAIDAYRRGEYRESVGYLNRALSNDLQEAQLDALLAGLDAARARMEPVLPSVEIDVSAADGAPRDAVLFVIARPPGGGMPYAVVRRPASHLPLKVLLDDTVSMNPDMPLSRAPAFEVVVRLSRSGMPAAQPGDWEWRSAALAAAELGAPVSLTAALEAPGPVPPAEPTPDAPGT